MAKLLAKPYVIIGGGLTGLILSALLEKAGKDFLLVEAQSEFGELVRGQQEHGVWLDYGLKTIPAGENASENPLVLLKKMLELSFGIESWTEVPLIWEKTGFSEFVGFGETKNRSLIEELNYYLQHPRLTVSGGWKILTDLLLQLIPEEKRLSRSIVTKLLVEESGGANKVTEIVINGETSVKADKFIFTLAPNLLQDILPSQSINPRVIQRMARTESWTAVSLDLGTPTKYSDAKNTLVLKDTAEEDFYVLGLFVSNVDPLRQSQGLHLSSWLTLLHPDLMHDDENASRAIKTLKKMLKRAFPDMLESATCERLLVIPNAVCSYEQLQLDEGSRFPGFSNLYVAGGHLKSTGANQGRNILASLSSAFDVAAHLTSELSQVVPTTQSRQSAKRKSVKFSTEQFSKSEV